MAPFPKVGIVILNWNQERDTELCLSSLKKIDYPNYEIVVVDNASSDGSPEKISAKFPGITVLKNRENLGFAEGNNEGIRYLLKRAVDLVLLLNNDTQVEPRFLNELVKVISSQQNIGIVGPKIFRFDDPKKVWYAGGYLNKMTGKTYHRGLNREDRGQYDRVEEVDFVTGCAMLIKADVLRTVGLLDPDYFFSYEDVDLCLRARKQDYRLLYVPSSNIRHKFAQGGGGRFSPLYIYYRVRNGSLFMRKNRFNPLKIAYNVIVNPAKMVIYTMLTGNFRGAWAAIRGSLDFLMGRYGKGPF